MRNAFITLQTSFISRKELLQELSGTWNNFQNKSSDTFLIKRIKFWNLRIKFYNMQILRKLTKVQVYNKEFIIHNYNCNVYGFIFFFKVYYFMQILRKQTKVQVVNKEFIIHNYNCNVCVFFFFFKVYYLVKIKENGVEIGWLVD